MSTDLELLELAAKAAGLPLKFGGDWHNVGAPHVEHKSWNPLANDGDALRLAVTLGLDVTSDSVEGESCCFSSIGAPSCEYWGDDAHAATRRAIVRAAAEIGRAMR